MGRKRIEGVPRERNGRPQREPQLTERQMNDNKSVVQAYREKVFGVDPRFLNDQRAETALGRLNLKWQAGDKAAGISNDQYLTGLRIRDDRNAYLRAIHAKPEYQEPRGLSDPDPAAYERFCERAKARWKAVMAILDEATRTFDAADAIWQIIHMDQDRPDMVGDLRAILNIIQVHDSGKKPEPGERRAA